MVDLEELSEWLLDNPMDRDVARHLPAIIAELTALRAKAAAGDRSLEAADALATSAHDVDELLLEENDRGNACIECGVQGIEGGPDDEEHEEGCRTGKLFAAISFYRTMRGAP